MSISNAHEYGDTINVIKLDISNFNKVFLIS